MTEELLLEYARNLGEDFLLIACGLPGTGKTGATRTVAKITGSAILRTDIIRQEVLKNEDIFDNKVASDIEKRNQVYDEVFRQAEESLKNNRSVMLDGTFITQALRKQAAEIAARHKLIFIILETECPQELAVSRVLRRSREDYQSNAVTEEAYLNNKHRFEKVDVDDLKRAYPDLNIIHAKANTCDDAPEKWVITDIEKR